MIPSGALTTFGWTVTSARRPAIWLWHACSSTWKEPLKVTGYMHIQSYQQRIVQWLFYYIYKKINLQTLFHNKAQMSRDGLKSIINHRQIISMLLINKKSRL